MYDRLDQWWHLVILKHRIHARKVTISVFDPTKHLRAQICSCSKEWPAQ